MTQAHLRPCPACSRHARVSEWVCPFCGSQLSDAFRASPEPQGPRARLSRAALVAFGALGAGSLALTAGCSSSVVTPLYGGSPMGGGAPDDGAATALDGSSGDARPEAGDDTSADARSDAPMAQPAYGIAVPVRDASEDHVGVTPLYGVAPGNG